MSTRIATLVVALGALSLVSLTGCGQVRETLPARSATEQLLVSTAADRATAEARFRQFQGKRVYLDVSNLESYDRPYLIARLRQRLLDDGVVLASTAEEAEVVVEVASGALSVNKRSYLLGVPELPVPIPFGGETLKFPEMPIFKIISYIGRAKILMVAQDPATRRKAATLPTVYGRSRVIYWWLLFLGPFERTDIPR